MTSGMPGEDVAGEVPPVRAEVERDRLAVLDQVLGVRHARVRQTRRYGVTASPSSALGATAGDCSPATARARRIPVATLAQAQPSSRRRSSLMPK